MSYETRSRSDRLKAAILTGELNSVLDLINKPISREEKYLVALITGKIDNLPAPISQLDRYMYNTVTKVGRGELPKNRQDFYWYRICTGYVGEGLPIPHTTSDILDYDLAKNSAFREWDTFVGKYVEIVNSRSGSCKNVKIFGETIQDVIMGDKGLPRFAPYILNEKVENGRVYKTDTIDGEMQLQVAGKTYQNLTPAHKNVSLLIGNWNTFVTDPIRMFKINTRYTIVIDIIRNDITSGVCTFTGSTNNTATIFLDGPTTSITPTTTPGRIKSVLTTKNDLSNCSYVGFWAHNPSTTFGTCVVNMQILEGDWTNKPLPDYIDGIESVGGIHTNTNTNISPISNLFNMTGVHRFYEAKNFMKPNTIYTAKFNLSNLKLNGNEDKGGYVFRVLYDGTPDFSTCFDVTKWGGNTGVHEVTFKTLNFPISAIVIWSRQQDVCIDVTDIVLVEGYIKDKSFVVVGKGLNIWEPNRYNKLEEYVLNNEVYNSLKIKLKPNTSYTFISKMKKPPKKQVVLNIATKPWKSSDPDKGILLEIFNCVSSDSPGKEFRKTFKTPIQGDIYLQYYENNNTWNGTPDTTQWIDEIFDIAQYEDYMSNTNFQPYIQPQVLEYPNLEIRSLPNGVADTLDVDTGIVTRRVGKVVLNGSENYKFDRIQTNTTRIYTDLPNSKDRSHYCDKILARINDESHGDYEYTTVISYRLYINFNKKTIGMTSGDETVVLEKSLNWLKANPTTIYYELETPIIEKVPPKVLKTYRGGTIVENANNVKGDFNPTLGLKYDTIVTPGTKYKLMADKSDIIKYSIGGQNGSFGPEVDITPTSQTPLYLSGNGAKINKIAMTSNYGLPGYFPEGLESCGDIEKGVIELDVCNRNLFDYTKTDLLPIDSNHNLMNEIIEDGLRIYRFTSGNYPNVVKIHLDAGSYTCIGDLKFSDGINRQMNILVYDDKSKLQFNRNYRETFRLTSAVDLYIGFETSGSLPAGVYAEFTNIQLSKDIYPGFQKHESQQIKQQVVGALKKLPNGICDEINFDTGEYIQRTKAIKITENYQFFKYAAQPKDPDVAIYYSTLICSDMDKRANYKKGYCDQFPEISNWYVNISSDKCSEGVYFEYTGNLPCIYVFVKKSRFDNTDTHGFSKWALDNKLSFIYQLAEPIVTKIPKQMINSYQAGTNLKTTNKVKGTVEATVAIFQEGV